ncbi:MAG: hypothetical protein LUG21_02435 [Clostridiales bacterium]|nr:hypothetical protein [Clostridiales bacterium]
MPKSKSRKITKRAKKPKSDFQQNLKQFHKVSKRHVLTLEAALSEDEKRHIFRYADDIRKCGNILVAEMKKNLEQMMRTKEYRTLLAEYGKAKECDDKKVISEYKRKFDEIQDRYNVTWRYCQDFMKDTYKNTSGVNIGAVFALAKAESIWRGIKRVLFSKGKTIHFKRRGDLPAIRAKQRDQGIVITIKDNRLYFKFNGMEFTHKDGDRFINDETGAIMEYLSNPNKYDHEAVDAYLKDNVLTDTYRPCYASLICKEIRGKLRVFIQITIEGKAMMKYNKKGMPRHAYGKGRVGCDIGVQTIAYTTDKTVGLENLAERGSSITHNERKQRLLQRKMDRSKRATNPENYNDDGTVKKGYKKWKFSNNYIKYRKQYSELSRINAENRHLAINETANFLRSQGDVFITEPKNADKLKKKAKKSTINNKVKNTKRKRFGHSVHNRCPGYFQAKVKELFESTGGSCQEVPRSYKASQYDHTSDEFIKKKLSQRMFKLSDGTKVQRDWYSSLLLYCANDSYDSIDRKRCLNCFEKQYEREQAMIDRIISEGKKIMNSGIKVGCI